jgi:hypothetical protein
MSEEHPIAVLRDDIRRAGTSVARNRSLLRRVSGV